MKNGKKGKYNRKIVIVRPNSYKKPVFVEKRSRTNENLGSEGLDNAMDYPDLDDDKTIDEIIEDMTEIANNPDAFNW